MNKIDIKIVKLLKHKKKGLRGSQLVLEISGKSINCIVINTLRRILLEEIPIYSFCNETINITENKSALNNDQIKLRLSLLPIYNINNNLKVLPEKFWKTIDFSSADREMHPEDDVKIEISGEFINNSPTIMNVTTNDIKIYKNDEIIKMYDSEFPILLIQLRPNDIFKFNMVGALGIGKRNSIWSSATCYYDDYQIGVTDEESHKYEFKIESQGQMDENVLFIKACDVMLYKLEKIEYFIKNTYYTSKVKNSTKIKLDLDNEDHTIGNILNDIIQNHPNVTKSGCTKPDHLVNRIVIKVETNKNDPTIPLFESINHLKKIFDTLKTHVKKL
jgi:DNA-directed RNA polymerase subunit L